MQVIIVVIAIKLRIDCREYMQRRLRRYNHVDIRKQVISYYLSNKEQTSLLGRQIVQVRQSCLQVIDLDGKSKAKNRLQCNIEYKAR